MVSPDMKMYEVFIELVSPNRSCASNMPFWAKSFDDAVRIAHAWADNRVRALSYPGDELEVVSVRVFPFSLGVAEGDGFLRPWNIFELSGSGVHSWKVDDGRPRPYSDDTAEQARSRMLMSVATGGAVVGSEAIDHVYKEIKSRDDEIQPCTMERPEWKE